MKKIKFLKLYFRRSRTAYSVAGCQVGPKTKHIQASMGVCVTCKNEEDPFKNESARVVTTDSNCKSMRIFYDAQGQITPGFEDGSI